MDTVDSNLGTLPGHLSMTHPSESLLVLAVCLWRLIYILICLSYPILDNPGRTD